MWSAVLGATFVVVLAVPAAAAAGDLDTTFSRDGRLIVQDRTGADMAVQGNGRIISVGSSTETPYNFGYGVRRVLANGAPDPHFAGDGETTITFTDPVDPGGPPCVGNATAVATTSTGSIIVAGTACGGDIAIAKLTPDGALDSSFGDNGRVVTPTHSVYIQAIALAADGTIVVAGNNKAFDAAVARYLPNGELDTSFARDGIRVVSVPGEAIVSALAVLPDGKVVIGGADYGAPGFPGSHPFVARLLARGGRLDPAFGAGGTTVLGPDSDTPAGFADLGLLATGEIIGVGKVGRNMIVARLTPNGAPDETFGPGGIQEPNFIRGCCEYGLGVALEASGDIVAVGSYECYRCDVGHGIVVAVYSPMGELDPAFGTDGIVATRIRTPGTTFYEGAAHLDGDGRIVIAARSNFRGPSLYLRYLAA